MLTIKSLTNIKRRSYKITKLQVKKAKDLFFFMQKSEVISIKEARKLLGQKSKNLTNGELEDLVRQTETVVRIAVRKYIGSINSNNNATIELRKTSEI